MATLKVLMKVRPIWVLLAMVTGAFIIGLFIPTTAQFRGPLVDINDTILVAVLVALGGFVAQLYLRLGKLENDLSAFRAKNEDLHNDLAAAASFINRVGLWVTAGMPPAKRPRPPKQLAEHIDAELWADDPAVGGTD